MKVNAYLTQELEFTNVSRLAGGVVAYDRTLREQAPTEEPMFKGVNYVFDGRMGRKITDDQLGTCYTCGSKTNLVTNCKNENCHRRMVQCGDCSNSFFGTCSGGCRTRIVNSGMAPMKNLVRSSPDGENLFGHSEDDEEKKDSIEDDEVYSTLDEYSAAYSSRSPSIYKEMELNTAALLPTGAHMVSGSTQGSLLTTLAAMSREGRILEIGTFTGYATARLLEGAAAAGACIGTDTIGTLARGGPFVLSLERDRRALAVASAHLKVMTEHGIGDVGASEASRLREVDLGTFLDVLFPCQTRSARRCSSHSSFCITYSSLGDFVDESISFIYKNIAGCELRRVNDALATIEEMAASNDDMQAPFDIVFVDADKTRLMDYVNALVSNDRVLKKGGLILVDNVLWKGLVLGAGRNTGGYDSGDELSEDEESLRKNRRARKLANKMHRFNSAVRRDNRVDVLLLNVRDGLSMIRKR